MDFKLFLVNVAAAIFTLLGTKMFYMVYGKFKVQKNKRIAYAFSSLPSPHIENSATNDEAQTLPRNYLHDVFPSFHGADVRRSFLSHIMKEFRSKGISPFVDNEIKRGEFIGPELKTAIQGSRIALVLLSKNYASSSWCLDELVEIMKCKEDLGQTVKPIFYEVDPTDIKKQTRDFGKVFNKTCEGKTNEVIGKWSQALEIVATIAGYHSNKWRDEATMIEDIATDISNLLNIVIPSSHFKGLIGMEDHMRKMEPLLRLDLEEVRMIGIWGPPGIGKSTIARCLFNQYSEEFQSRALMVNIKGDYPRPCLDEGSAQLQLQSQMLSKMLNHKDIIVISHLGVAQERLKYKKVLLVLDDVDRLAQLDALAEKTSWFGRGSRIIITTEDLRVLKQHRIKDIYKVDYPTDDQAFQMFCMYAFGQKYPEEGFEDLARQVTYLAGNLPLGLQVMGSHFRNMYKEEWEREIQKLWRSLDGKIESILQFSYDALWDEDQYLFLHIACFFKGYLIKEVVEHLKKTFPDVKQRLDVLIEKSLIYMFYSNIEMNSLLEKMGRDIVRKQSHDPGQRQFLVNDGEICDVLMGDETGSRSVIGINFICYEDEQIISERAFEKMSNLQFLNLRRGCCQKGNETTTWHLPHGLSYLSPQLRLLDWWYFPMTCFPANVNLKFLVELNMRYSKLEKLWDGIKSYHYYYRSDFLVKLPSSIGNATNLQTLNLRECSSLVELPSSIGNLHKVSYLNLNECPELKVLPVNVNLKSLDRLDLRNCSSLKSFPEISTNVSFLDLRGTAIEGVPESVKGWSRLLHLILRGCKELLSLPQLPDSLTRLDLNKEARDLLLQRSTRKITVLPGKEIPTCFTHRANGGSLKVELSERHFPSSLIFKACILLVEREEYYETRSTPTGLYYKVYSDEGTVMRDFHKLFCTITEHLYIFEFQIEDVTSNKLFFEFVIENFLRKWVIKECG
ncbi:hypothetical protein EUTSA_v10019540mg, partial [Eutrema salsugineum]